MRDTGNEVALTGLNFPRNLKPILNYISIEKMLLLFLPHV